MIPAWGTTTTPERTNRQRSSPNAIFHDMMTDLQIHAPDEASRRRHVMPVSSDCGVGDNNDAFMTPPMNSSNASNNEEENPLFEASYFLNNSKENYDLDWKDSSNRQQQQQQSRSRELQLAAWKADRQKKSGIPTTSASRIRIVRRTALNYTDVVASSRAEATQSLLSKSNGRPRCWSASAVAPTTTTTTATKITTSAPTTGSPARKSTSALTNSCSQQQQQQRPRRNNKTAASTEPTASNNSSAVVPSQQQQRRQSLIPTSTAARAVQRQHPRVSRRDTKSIPKSPRCSACTPTSTPTKAEPKRIPSPTTSLTLADRSGPRSQQEQQNARKTSPPKPHSKGAFHNSISSFLLQSSHPWGVAAGVARRSSFPHTAAAPKNPNNNSNPLIRLSVAAVAKRARERAQQPPVTPSQAIPVVAFVAHSDSSLLLVSPMTCSSFTSGSSSLSNQHRSRNHEGSNESQRSDEEDEPAAETSYQIASSNLKSLLFLDPVELDRDFDSACSSRGQGPLKRVVRTPDEDPWGSIAVQTQQQQREGTSLSLAETTFHDASSCSRISELLPVEEEKDTSGVEFLKSVHDESAADDLFARTRVAPLLFQAPTQQLQAGDTNTNHTAAVLKAAAREMDKITAIPNDLGISSEPTLETKQAPGFAVHSSIESTDDEALKGIACGASSPSIVPQYCYSCKVSPSLLVHAVEHATLIKVTTTKSNASTDGKQADKHVWPGSDAGVQSPCLGLEDAADKPIDGRSEHIASAAAKDENVKAAGEGEKNHCDVELGSSFIGFWSPMALAATANVKCSGAFVAKNEFVTALQLASKSLNADEALRSLDGRSFSSALSFEAAIHCDTSYSMDILDKSTFEEDLLHTYRSMNEEEPIEAETTMRSLSIEEECPKLHSALRAFKTFDWRKELLSPLDVPTNRLMDTSTMFLQDPIYSSTTRDSIAGDCSVPKVIHPPLMTPVEGEHMSIVDEDCVFSCRREKTHYASVEKTSFVQAANDEVRPENCTIKMLQKARDEIKMRDAALQKAECEIKMLKAELEKSRCEVNLRDAALKAARSEIEVLEGARTKRLPHS